MFFLKDQVVDRWLIELTLFLDGRGPKTGTKSDNSFHTETGCFNIYL